MLKEQEEKAQGALEYLIIVAAVLAIASIVVLFLTGAFGGQRTAASLARCQQTASNCGAQLLIAPAANCTECYEACMDPITGEEVAPDAISLCKQGKPEKIGAKLAVCGNGEINEGEECDGSNLNGETCESLGYIGGTLSCNEDCTFDTSGCTTEQVCTGGEVRSCSEVGYYNCGTAICYNGEWDTSECGCSMEACSTDHKKYPDEQCELEADFDEENPFRYCYDGVDGDGDGDIDCGDDECASAEFC